MYEEFIMQLSHVHKSNKNSFAKGYLPISLISPSKLQEILNAVKEAI